MQSDQQKLNTNFFDQAFKLNNDFRDILQKNEIHFRGSINSLSLISVSRDKPELGVRCKNHDDWTSEILHTYICKINCKPNPKRITPEKALQAWLIKKALKTENRLEFDKTIHFIASELAIYNDNGAKIVSDIIGYDTKTNQLVIIELKSERLLKKLIAQVNTFRKIVEDNFQFFQELVSIYGFSLLEKKQRKVVVWPGEKKAPLEKFKEEGIEEYMYNEDGDNYSFRTFLEN